MVKKLAIIREIFKGDHNAAAARKLRRTQTFQGRLNIASQQIFSVGDYTNINFSCTVN